MRTPASLAGFALVAVSLLVALGLGEVALRVTGFSFEIAPQAVEFGWPDPVVMEERYRGDPDLFWVPQDYPERLEGLALRRPDLVFLGDSCTEFSDYPRQVAAGLGARRPGEKWAAANFGVGGWSSYQGIQQMRRDVAPLAPRAVTVYYGWNDHWIGFGIEDREIHRLSRSWLGSFESLRVAQLLFKSRLALAARKAQKPNRVSPEDFRANLAGIAALARERGILPVLLTAPSSHRRGQEPARLGERWLQDLADLVPLHQRYVAIVREVARSEAAPLCDLAAHFDAAPPEARNAAFWDDGIHLTPAGSRRVAELVVECLDAAL